MLATRHRHLPLPLPGRFFLALFVVVPFAPPAAAWAQGAAVPAGPIAVAGRAVTGVETGPGLAGARVRLMPIPFEADEVRLKAAGEWPPAAVAEATADASGWFRLAAPGPGWWAVEVSATGRAATICRLEPLVEELMLGAVSLAPVVAWTATVEGPEGKPVAGARVTVRFPDFDEMEPAGIACRPADRQATTGAQGRATLELPARFHGGTVTAAGADGVETAPVRLVSGGGDAGEREVRLRLPRARSHTLAVRGAHGEAPAGPAVAMDDRGWALGALGVDGRLQVASAADRGRPVLVVADDGRAGWGSAGDRRRLTLEAPATWSPRVVDAATGRALAGALVGLDRRIGGGESLRRPLAAATAGADGRATLTVAGLVGDDAPGDLELWAAAPGYLPLRIAVAAADRAARRPAPVVELVAAAKAEGLVVDPAERPLAGALVTVATDAGLGRRSARTGADGRFSVSGLAARSGLSVDAALDGYTRGSAYRPRGSADELRLVLQPLQRLVGRVVDEAGRPLAGALVAAVPGGAIGLRMPRYGFARRRLATTGAAGPVETGGDGRFALAGVSPGRATVAVAAAGYAARLLVPVEIAQGASRPVDLGDVVLVSEAALEGRVVDPAGDPVAGVRVGDLEGAGGAAAALRAAGEHDGAVASDAQGRFRLGELTPGERIDLELRHPDYDGRVLRGVEVPADPPLTVVLRPLARVEGRVVDEQGRPLAGASVQALNDDGGGRSQATEADGTFRFSCMAGRMRVGAAAPGRSAASTPPFRLAAGEVRTGIELVLAAGAELAGRVLDGRDRPVTSAIVLWRPEAPDPGAEAMRQGLLDLNSTDDAGRFRIEGLAAGAGTLVVIDEVLGSLHRPLELAPGQQEVELRYAGANDRYSVSGRVVDEAGAGVAGSWVMLEPRAGGAEGRSGLSEADGSFLVDGVPAGAWKLTASPPGHNAVAFPAEGASLDLEIAGPVADLLLRLPVGAEVSGQLLGVGPEEWPAVSVWGESARGRLDTVLPDAAGRYRLGGVPPGRWRLIAVRPARDAERAQAVVEIAPGQREATVDLDFGGGRTLAGRVTRGGEPLAEGAVALLGGDSHGSPLDVRGEFHLRGLAAGSYQLTVRGERGATLHREAVTMAGEDAFLEIEIAPAALVGRVIDAERAEPLAEARVELSAVEEGGREPIGRTTTDLDGGFSFGQTAPGTVVVRASAPGYAAAEAEVELSAGSTEAVELALVTGDVAVFSVTGPDGRPPVAVAVELRDERGGLVHAGGYEVGEGGEVRVPGAAAGTWTAIVASWGTGGVRTTVTVPGPPVAVVLPPAARLLIEVPELIAEVVEGGAAAAAQVAILDPQGLPAPRASFETGTAVVLRWGEAVVEGLPPGLWTVTATAADGRSWRGAVSLEGGDAATVRLE